MGEAYHYYHHRFFDVNFAGGGVTFLDQWFGSAYFGPDDNRESENDNKKINHTSSRRSYSSHDDDEEQSSSSSSLTHHLDKLSVQKFGEILAKAPLDEKVTVNPFSSISKGDGMISPFMFLTILCWIPWALEFFSSTNKENHHHQFALEKSLLASAGPLAVAVILDLLTNHQKDFSKILPLLSRPFGAKRPTWETILHFVLGISMSVVPVFVLLYRCVA